MRKPQNREEVERLLGLVNYVGNYIVKLSNRTTYIRTLLCENTDWNWSHEHEDEWQDLKKLWTHKPVIAYYDVTLKTKVSTDTCKRFFCNYWKPLAYTARSMTMI